jgi:hypothetical protein
MDVIDNTYSLNEENKSLAIELLENSLNVADKRKLMTAVEKILSLNTIVVDSSQYNEDAHQAFLNYILKNNNSNFSSWLVSNCIRLYKKSSSDIQLPEALMKSDIKIVMQELTKNPNDN